MANVVSNFFIQALNNEDITVFGEGSQTRSFCYVDDLIDGLMKMMNGPDEFPGPVNLGNPGEFTILELAEKIIELTASKSKIIFKPLPQDDPMQRQPDISLVEEKLFWKPVVNLEEGLKKTVRYFESSLLQIFDVTILSLGTHSAYMFTSSSLALIPS